jgi:hypothetical protein
VVIRAHTVIVDGTVRYIYYRLAIYSLRLALLGLAAKMVKLETKQVVVEALQGPF